MAEKKDVDEGEEAASAKPAKSSMKLIVFMAVGALALIGISIGGTLLLVGGKTPAADEEAEEAADDGKEAKKVAKNDKDKDKDGKKKKKKKGKGKDKDGEEKPVTVSYLPLDPPFVVNFQNPGQARFLQVSMEVMSRENGVGDDVKKHMPAIRNSLVLLLSGQSHETLSTPEGKEKIRAMALAEIRKILKEHTGKDGVEQVYFTGFVMQ
jgi:flagellar FliL protein